MAELLVVWRSVAANGFVILLATYATSTIGLIGLAFCVRSLGRRMTRLSKDADKYQLLLDKLNKSDDDHERSIAALRDRLVNVPHLPLAASTNNLTPDESFTPDAMAALRTEIESLVTDLEEGERQEEPALKLADR